MTVIFKRNEIVSGELIKRRPESNAGKRLAVTVSGLHHAGTTLPAAHPSDRGIGGKVHPRAPGRRGHAHHIGGLAVVL